MTTPKKRRSWREWLLLRERLTRARQRGTGADDGSRASVRTAGSLRRSAGVLLDMPEQSQASLLLLHESAWRSMSALLAAWGDESEDGPVAIWQRFRNHPRGAELLQQLPLQARKTVEAMGDDGGQISRWETDRDTERRRRVDALERLADHLLRSAERAVETHAEVLRLRAGRVAALVLGALLTLGGAVIAYRQLAYATNFALYRPVELSSVYSLRRFPKEGLTDGRVRALGCHTKEQKQPWARIDLMVPRKVRRVVVVNRRDDFRERAVPLVVELSADGLEYSEVARQETPFSEWSAEIPRQPARYVRLRVDSEEPVALHLNEVEVY